MPAAELEHRVAALIDRLGPLALQLEFAVSYVATDPPSSLTKSRSVLEKVVLEIHRREFGTDPRKPLLGDMLANPDLARRIDRRMLSRMNAIRDMANLGPHGEFVNDRDALRVLADLCEVLEWFIERYGGTGPATRDRAAPAPAAAAAASAARRPASRRRARLLWGAAVATGVAVAATLYFASGGGGNATAGPPAGPQPRAPTLTAPPDGVRLAAPPVPLRWEPPAGLPPATYEVEVLRLDAAGEALGAPQTARVPLTYVIWPWTAEAGASGHYRWRVRVVEPTSLAWSAARSFVLYPSNLDRILDSRTLRVGMEMTYHRPFAWYDVAAQELTGFDIDLAAVIAARLGVAWVPLPLAWDDLFAAVESDRVDLVVSAVTITEERARRFAFSRAYFETGQRLTALARVDRDFGPGSPPFVVATQRGTSSAEAAARLPGAELRLFDTLDLAIAALSAREVDALISDEVLSPANRDPSFRFVGERLTTEGYGVMLARGDPAFLARIDAIVADLASSGWLAGQLRKYGLSSGPAP